MMSCSRYLYNGRTTGRLVQRGGHFIPNRTRIRTPFAREKNLRASLQSRLASPITMRTFSIAAEASAKQPVGWHRRLLRLTGATLVSATGLGIYGWNTDEGVQRSFKFLYYCLPIMIHYRWVELTDNQTETFERLHQKYAQTMLDIVLYMGGFYVKLAQACAMIPICPELIARKFSVLQDNAPYQPMKVIRPIIEAELGAPFDEIFAEFDAKPLGAASIGQVHSAMLLVNDQDSWAKTMIHVVVKVQYPNAERNFNVDMTLAVNATRIVAPAFTEIVENLRKNFVNEFNYVNEARLQQLVYEGIQDYARKDEIEVPRPFLNSHPLLPKRFRSETDLSCPLAGNERSTASSRATSSISAQETRHADSNVRDGLCTKNVMVMDRLDGQTITRFGAIHLLRMARQHGYGDDVAKLKKDLMNMPEEDIIAKFGAPPSREMLKNYLRLIRWRNFLYDDCFAKPVNFCLAKLSGGGSPALKLYSREKTPPNIYEVMDLIFGVGSHLLFWKGLANGDPHAGNVMLLNNGRVGFIDFGQVRKLDLEKRLRMAKCVCAVGSVDKNGIPDEVTVSACIQEAGFFTYKRDPWIANKVANAYFGRWDDYATKELGGPAKWEENINRIDPLESLGDEDGDSFMALRSIFLSTLTCRQLGLMQVYGARQMLLHAQERIRALGEDGEEWLAELIPGRTLPSGLKPDLSRVYF